MTMSGTMTGKGETMGLQRLDLATSYLVFLLGVVLGLTIYDYISRSRSRKSRGRKDSADSSREDSTESSGEEADTEKEEEVNDKEETEVSGSDTEDDRQGKKRRLSESTESAEVYRERCRKSAEELDRELKSLNNELKSKDGDKKETSTPEDHEDPKATCCTFPVGQRVPSCCPHDSDSKCQKENSQREPLINPEAGLQAICDQAIKLANSPYVPQDKTGELLKGVAKILKEVMSTVRPKDSEIIAERLQKAIQNDILLIPKNQTSLNANAVGTSQSIPNAAACEMSSVNSVS